jgi:hypothetical protein
MARGAYPPNRQDCIPHLPRRTASSNRRAQFTPHTFIDCILVPAGIAGACAYPGRSASSRGELRCQMRSSCAAKKGRVALRTMEGTALHEMWPAQAFVAVTRVAEQ